MIRMIQSNSAGHAKDYFSEALLKSDYYLGDQELNGMFRGALSKRLGITGIATKDKFHALCENRHPDTGQRLTPRTGKDRTVGYDINFHVPKSVSILHALAKDNHILEAFQASVLATMSEIEEYARARVRKGRDANGRTYADRKTGELLYVDFIHQTARPVEGFAPDPHLHAHCYVFNMTFDAVENQMKACQFREINKEMPYFQTMFHKRLADHLVALGYQVRRTETSFEVVGVPQPVIELFSKRTDAIGRVAKEKGITDAKELSELGARTRAKKQKGLSMDELRTEWRNQIRAIELENDTYGYEAEEPVRFGPVKESNINPNNLSVEQCTGYALSHCFERASVVSFNHLAKTAIGFSIGSAVTPEAIVAALESHPDIIRVTEGDKELCTTAEVLREEQRMVQLARDGKGRLAPLYHETPTIEAPDQQGAAIRHILTTADMVSIVRGAAGAGKTTLMREAVSHIEAAGKTVTVLAPTARASRGVLREEGGFKKAETVALFLASEKMQERIKDQVLWVDEAGMLGTKDMAALLEITTARNARVILGGDTRQHASVVRGDALRILNTVGGIRTAEVDKIYRQKDEIYRRAVADLSKGHIADGFEKLDSIGAICEMSSFSGRSKLVDDYVKAMKAGKDVLAVSPTHREGEAVTAGIRERLKAEGLIGKKEISARRLKNVNLTEAERGDWRKYIGEHLFVQFDQNVKGIRRGSLWAVESTAAAETIIRNDQGDRTTLPLDQAKHFSVYKRTEIALAKGDRVQITKNGFDRDKKRLNNGQVFDVMSVTKKGQITLRNLVSKVTYEIDTTYGHLNHAHCLTSYASQGKTVDEIFIAQPVTTFRATDAKQFYVSVSRAREKVTIYTDDKERLLDHAAEAGDRQSAMELLKTKDTHLEHVLQVQREADKGHQHNADRQREPDREPHNDFTLDYDDYEPGF